MREVIQYGNEREKSFKREDKGGYTTERGKEKIETGKNRKRIGREREGNGG